MIARLKHACRILRDNAGTMSIETALVAPVLATMALGAFEGSSMLSRQQQLQSAANEASEIILAAANGTGVTSSDLEDILEASLDIKDDQLTIAARYRCDDSTSLVSTKPTSTCPTSKPIYTYVKLTLTEKYTPVWTSFGIGKAVTYKIERTIQIS